MVAHSRIEFKWENFTFFSTIIFVPGYTQLYVFLRNVILASALDIILSLWRILSCPLDNARAYAYDAYIRTTTRDCIDLSELLKASIHAPRRRSRSINIV